MRMLLPICLFSILTTFLTAQVSKSITVSSAGTLTTLLTATEKINVTNLTITGNIDARDFKCMRNEMTVLADLDISNVSINAYNGIGGTSSATSTYSANQIPEYAFYLDNTMTGKNTLKSISLPITCLSIGNYAFSNCIGLSDIIIPNNIFTIGHSAFAFCNGISTVTIGNNVMYIGMSAFYNCTKLTTLTIGSTVSSIGSSAFCICTNLNTIYSLNVVPPVLGSSCFGYVNNVTAVYVPSSSVATYKTAVGWSDSFLSVILANDVFGIKASIGLGGSVIENSLTLTDGSLISVNPSATKTFTLLPNVGYEISSLMYNGLDVKTQITNNQFTTPAVNANGTLSVTFKKTQYRVSLKDAATGTMNLICDYGMTPSFDFTPTIGWRVNTILYNSTDVTNSLVNGIYTLPSITANSLLNVSFVSIVSGAPELINTRYKVYGTKSEIIVDGTSEGETVTLYEVNGRKIQTVMSKGERLNLPVERDRVYLVKTGEKTFKVIL